MELEPSDDNFLEQLVESMKRIELGLDAIYSAIVVLDERAQARARAAMKELT